MRLTVDRLAFGYPSKLVGEDASFTLGPGEVVCLLGPNGSGKTTLFKTVLGLLVPHGGMVSIDGEATASWSRRRLARAMGYVPQAHNAFFPFSVLEAVLMGRTPHMGLFASPSKSDIAIAEQVLETLNISHLRDAIYTRISGGERQLALIARALAQEPEILIMDEPTASLDFGNQMLVLNQIRRLAASGIAIILSTHDPDHAFHCAHRVAMLHEGRLAHLGVPEEVITSESLKQLYGVDVSVVELPEYTGSNGRPAHVCVPSQADTSY
ncbi:MAG: ABC transporter ATP-binding protein, partial [Acidiferrobacterales bacterium]